MKSIAKRKQIFTEAQKNAAEVKEYISKLKEINKLLDEKDEQIHSIQWDYKKIFNLISDSIVLLDDEGLIIDLNRKAYIELHKYTDVHKQLIGSKGKNIVEKMGGNGNASIEKKVLENSKIHESEKEIYVNDLNKHFLITIIAVEKSVHPNYFIIILRDISSIKKLRSN